MSSRRQGFFPRAVRHLNQDPWNWAFVVLFFGAVGLCGLALVDAVFRRGAVDFWLATEPVIGVATLVAVLLAWFVNLLKSMEMEQEVEIVMRSGDRHLTLPYHPLRLQLNRAELLGILGVYYGELRYPSTELRRVLEPGPDGSSMLNEVIKGNRDTLVLDLPPEVFDVLQRNLRGEEA